MSLLHFKVLHSEASNFKPLFDVPKREEVGKSSTFKTIVLGREKWSST